jgi:hypothetical protein
LVMPFMMLPLQYPNAMFAAYQKHFQQATS